MKRGFASSKDLEHKAFLRGRPDREEKWISARKDEINQLTIKGIQPQIERLVKKHREVCEEIRCDTMSTKQKLEIQSEIDLSERIELYRSNEQQYSTRINRRNEFAHAMAKEQNDHAANLMNLREKLMQEEEAKRKAHLLDMQRLKRENEAALDKSKAPKTMQNLFSLLSNEKDAKRQELEFKLDRIGKDRITLQTTWEKEWMEASRTKSDGIIQQKKKELLEWRETRVRDIIKNSIAKQSSLPIEQCKSETNDEFAQKAAHQNNLDRMKRELDVTQSSIQELEMKLSSTAISKTQVIGKLTNLRSLESVINGELENAAKNKVKQNAHNNNMFDMASDRINRSMEQLHRRHEEIKSQISRMETEYNQETS